MFECSPTSIRSSLSQLAAARKTTRHSKSHFNISDHSGVSSSQVYNPNNIAAMPLHIYERCKKIWKWEKLLFNCSLAASLTVLLRINLVNFHTFLLCFHDSHKKSGNDWTVAGLRRSPSARVRRGREQEIQFTIYIRSRNVIFNAQSTDDDNDAMWRATINCWWWRVKKFFLAFQSNLQI